LWQEKPAAAFPFKIKTEAGPGEKQFKLITTETELQETKRKLKLSTQLIAMTPAAALRPHCHASEAGRQTVPGLTASCGPAVLIPAGLFHCRHSSWRCILNQVDPFHLSTELVICDYREI